jgi:altronate hydrolase
MLYEIESQPTAQNAVILLHSRDNVVVARVALSDNQDLEVNGTPISTREPIPAGHKLAIKAVRPGEPVYRYGNVIGFATARIEPGDHVHVHNLGYKELDASEIVPGEGSEIHLPRLPRKTFLGFQRDDGRVGTRNYIVVVAASNCAAYTSELIAQSFADEALPTNVDGVVAFPHGEGCGQAIGPDTEQLERTLKGVLDHPNVSAALILGLGCEVNQIGHYLGNGSASNAPAALQGLTLQESGGTLGAVEAARKQIQQYIDRAAACKRVDVPAAKIVL